MFRNGYCFLVAVFMVLLFVITPAYSYDMPKGVLPPFPFMSNAGQFDNEVAFSTNTSAGTVFITAGGEIVYAMPPSDGSAIGWVLREKPIIADSEQFSALPRGTNKLPIGITRINGKGTHGTHQGGAYSRIEFGDIAPGISFLLEARNRNIEKILRIEPHADVSGASFRLEGALSLVIDEGGQLVAETGMGSFCFTTPVAWQGIGENRTEVAVQYVVDGNEYGFQLGSYDSSLPVMIDPLLGSTYLGETDYSSVGKTRVLLVRAADGSIYTAYNHVSKATTYPSTTGGYLPAMAADTVYPGTSLELDNYLDIVIARFDANFTTLLSATFFGGWGAEIIHDMTFDGSGNLVFTGETMSSNFPTTAGVSEPSPVNSSSWYMGFDASFVAVLSADLSTLRASTLVTNKSLQARCVAVGPNGDIYVGGTTNSIDLPTTNYAYQTSIAHGDGYTDGFLARFDFDLTSLKALTYLGGDIYDTIESVQVNSAGVYVAGGTYSTGLYGTFPTTTGALQEGNSTISEGGVFVSRLSADLSQLQASTFVDGAGSDVLHNMRLDSQGKVWIVGRTDSAWHSTANAYQSVNAGGYGDMVVARLNADLSIMEASTLLGNYEYNDGWDVAVYGDYVYIIGNTNGGYFTLDVLDENQWQPNNASRDSFIVCFDRNLTTMLGNTYLGGTSYSHTMTSLHVDVDGVFAAGYTNTGLSGDAGLGFPTTSSAWRQTSSITSDYSSEAVAMHFDLTLGAGGTVAIPTSVVLTATDTELYTGDVLSLDASLAGSFPAGSDLYVALMLGDQLLFFPSLTPTPEPFRSGATAGGSWSVIDLTITSDISTALRNSSIIFYAVLADENFALLSEVVSKSIAFR